MMMAIPRIKWHWIAGGISVIVFVLLLAFRLDIFDREKSPFGISRDGLVSTGYQTFQDKESWMNISQNGRKIGYAHRRFFRTDKGYLRVRFYADQHYGDRTGDDVQNGGKPETRYDAVFL